MGTKQLTSDIFLLLLQYFTDDVKGRIEGWKKSLPLLAVCAQWRQLALPLFYSTAYIYGKTKGGLINENISLAVENRLSGYIKKLDIRAANEELHDSLKYIFHIIKNNGECWPNVNEIKICFSYNGETVDITPFNEQMVNLIDDVNILLPNINRLDLFSIDWNPHGSWESKLVTSYIPQLIKLKSIERLAICAPEFSKNLTYLHININIGDIPPVPKICTESLQHLVLDSLPANYSWNAFVNKSGSEKIIFSNLKTLKVFYGNDIQQTSTIGTSRYVFYFPKLKSMHIYGAPSSCVLLLQMKLPTRMECVSIFGNVDISPILLKQKIQHIGRLEISFTNPGIVNIPEARSRHLQIIRQACKQETLQISWLYDLTYKEVQSLRFPHLMHLSTESRIDPYKLLALLKNTIKLRSLKCQVINIFDGVGKLQIPDACSLERIQPVCPELKYASFWLHYDVSVIGDAYIFLQYMLLSCASLRRFEAPNINTEPLQRFVGKYKEAYPHLNNIVIS